MRLLCGSINVRERPWASKRQPIDYKRCCTDRLNAQGKAGLPLERLSMLLNDHSGHFEGCRIIGAVVGWRGAASVTGAAALGGECSGAKRRLHAGQAN